MAVTCSQMAVSLVKYRLRSIEHIIGEQVSGANRSRQVMTDGVQGTVPSDPPAPASECICNTGNQKRNDLAVATFIFPGIDAHSSGQGSTLARRTQGNG